MKQQFIFFVSIFLLVGCQGEKEIERHLFYLHGRIIEVQGINAVSDQFGTYMYTAIIDSLQATGATVHHEVRTQETDFQSFCGKTSAQVDSLIEAGVPPGHITVLGASKGAVMAMNIADMNTNAINYILLAANNDYIERENDWNLHGNILGIYEQSDLLAGKDYQYWIKTSTNALSFEQQKINTGLGHGFLYQPLPVWLNPVKEWMNKKREIE